VLFRSLLVRATLRFVHFTIGGVLSALCYSLLYSHLLSCSLVCSALFCSIQLCSTLFYPTPIPLCSLLPPSSIARVQLHVTITHFPTCTVMVVCEGELLLSPLPLLPLPFSLFFLPLSLLPCSSSPSLPSPLSYPPSLPSLSTP